MAKHTNNANIKARTITVIVPMYNAEKYVRDCMQSLVDQTFQDFDIIVVNDCSTDNSVAEVEKFLPHFKDRLQIKSLPKNTGGSAIPKNTAIQMARGKYITFLDIDDFFTKTALEELVKIAELTNAEVVHSSHYFTFKDGTTEMALGTFQRTCYVNQPTPEPFDIGARVKKFTERGFLWWGCNKLFLRDFLLQNNINFPAISVWEDLVFAFQCVVCAQNYVRVPNVFYHYRIREDSLSHIPKDPLDITESLIKVIGYLDDFMERIEFFQKNPQFKYLLLDWHIQGRMDIIGNAFYDTFKMHPMQMEMLFRKKFADKFPKELLEFSAYFFSIAAFQRNFIQKMLKENNELKQKVSNLEMNLAMSKVNSFLK